MGTGYKRPPPRSPGWKLREVEEFDPDDLPSVVWTGGPEQRSLESFPAEDRLLARRPLAPNRPAAAPRPAEDDGKGNAFDLLPGEVPTPSARTMFGVPSPATRGAPASALSWPAAAAGAAAVAAAVMGLAWALPRMSGGGAAPPDSVRTSAAVADGVAAGQVPGGSVSVAPEASPSVLPPVVSAAASTAVSAVLPGNAPAAETAVATAVARAEARVTAPTTPLAPPLPLTLPTRVDEASELAARIVTPRPTSSAEAPPALAAAPAEVLSGRGVPSPTVVAEAAPPPTAVPPPVPTPTPVPVAATAAPPPGATRSAASPAPSVASVASAASSTAAVERALGRYRSAFNALDAGAARGVWPTVNERALTRAFSLLQDQELTFDACDIAITGARAEAACRGSSRFVPRVGNRAPQTERRQWKFELVLRDEAWRIQTVEAR